MSPLFLHEFCSQARPVLTGRWAVGPSGLQYEHYHDSLELLWAERTIAISIEGGPKQPLPAGSVVVIAPLQPHIVDEHEAPPTSRLSGSHMAIREDFLGVTPSHWRSGILTPAHAAVVLPALAHVLRRSLSTPDGLLSADLLGVVRGILHALRDFGYTVVHDNSPGAALPPVTAALNLIALRWADPALSVEDLAVAAGLGLVRFRHVFRLATGLRPSVFLDRIRIDHARVLMCRQSMKSRSLARTCGFGSQSAFFRCYKRIRGRTPGMDQVLTLSG